MRFPRISLLPLLFIPFLSCDTQADFEDDFENYFVKYYGQDGDQEAVDFISNPDGTALLLGKTDSPDGRKRILLIKVNPDGNVIWQKTFGSGLNQNGLPVDENPQDIEAAADGLSYFILSNIQRLEPDPATNELLYDFKVIRIDSDGDVLDGMEWGNNPTGTNWNTQFAKSITPFSDGSFAITGNSTNEALYVDNGLGSETDQEDLFIIVFDSNYQEKWSNVSNVPGIGDARGETLGSGVKVFENLSSSSPCNLVMFSYSNALRNNTTFELNFNIVGFTDLGSAIPVSGHADPDHEFAGVATSSEVLASVCRVPNLLGGGYYEVGTTAPASATSGDLYFCRRNRGFVKTEEGEINGLNGNLAAAAVSPSLISEGFLILADEETPSGKTIKLIQIDLSNRVKWTTNFGSPEKSGNKAANVAELPDGRILVFATIELETQFKMALIKVNRKGELLN